MWRQTEPADAVAVAEIRESLLSEELFAASRQSHRRLLDIRAPRVGGGDDSVHLGAR
jgi:hypothetical protein